MNRSLRQPGNPLVKRALSTVRRLSNEEATATLACDHVRTGGSCGTGRYTDPYPLVWRQRLVFAIEIVDVDGSREEFTMTLCKQKGRIDGYPMAGPPPMLTRRSGASGRWRSSGSRLSARRCRRTKRAGGELKMRLVDGGVIAVRQVGGTELHDVGSQAAEKGSLRFDECTKNLRAAGTSFMERRRRKIGIFACFSSASLCCSVRSVREVGLIGTAELRGDIDDGQYHSIRSFGVDDALLVDQRALLSRVGRVTRG